jgi:eukaryotic-like serine/threonine-protein kinase
MSLTAGAMLTDSLLLERELGSGGMGTVWLARNCALDSHVAVKVLHAHGGGQADVARQRFEREARGLARLDHPHIVRIFDFGITIDGEPYIVMELLRGEDLKARLERVGRLSPAETASIVAQACKALTRAHAEGVVHRDIKPANLFLLPTDGEEDFVKVLDFGVAKFASSDEMAMTSTGTLMGTPSFMSPEQLLDPKRIDHRTDLWALGVVVYACLTGSLPFAGETISALGLAVYHGQFSAPSLLRPELGAALDAWTTRALHRDPEGRFQSARELSESLSAAVSAVARPSSIATSAAWPQAHSAQQSVAAPLAGASTQRAEHDPAASLDPSARASLSSSPARPPSWLWPAAAAVVASLIAVVVTASVLRGGDTPPTADDGDDAGERERRRAKRKAREESASKTPEDPNDGPTASTTRVELKPPASHARPSEKLVAPPEPPATPPDPPKSTRSTGAAAGRATTCWKNNEGSQPGMLASSVNITVTVDEIGKGGPPKLGGPATAHAGFVACTVTRVSELNWGPGPAETLSFGVGLPAGPEAPP